MQTLTHQPQHAFAQTDELLSWQTLIVQGNQAFQACDYSAAAQRYQQAGAHVRPLLFNDVGHADATIAAWVISYLNLADACEQLGQSDAQGLHLCSAHETLCRAAANPRLDDVWRMAAWRHSRRTYAELARFARRHPHHMPACAALFLGAAGTQDRSAAH